MRHGMQFLGAVGLALGLGAASTASASQITTATVVGGSIALAAGTYDTGQFNATHIVDEQFATSISEPNDATNFWLAPTAETPKYVVVDLGAAYDVKTIDLFNTHNRVFNDRGTLSFTIDASNSLVAGPAGTGQDLGGTPSTILAGNLTVATQAQDPIEADRFTDANGLVTGNFFRYLRFNALTIGAANFNGNSGLGLNEIRFFIPEPTSAGMFLCGIAGMLARRKR